MNIGAGIAAYGIRGAPQISSERIDANASVLNNDEKSTLRAVASLQGESDAHTFTRYGLTKHATEQGIAFMGSHVEDVDDYVKALVQRAEKQGGEDMFGVTAKEYGRLIDERV